MEIRIPLISYGRVELLEEGYESLEFFDCYVRLRGRSKAKEPKDYEDEQSPLIEKIYNYDVIGIKSHLMTYGKRYDSEEDYWTVRFDFVDGGSWIFRFKTHAESKNLYDKIHRWYFEGIVE